MPHGIAQRGHAPRTLAQTLQPFARAAVSTALTCALYGLAFLPSIWTGPM